MEKDKRRQRPIVLAALSSGGQVVRSLTCLVVLAYCLLAVPGCAIFNKKTTDSKPPATGGGDGPAPAKCVPITKTGEGEFMGKRQGFETSFSIKRGDFGITAGKAGKMLGEEVMLMIALEVVQAQKPK